MGCRGAGRMPQTRRAVAQAALARQIPGRSGKDRHLRSNAKRSIGVAEMGHEGYFVDLGQRVEAAPCGAVAPGREAQSVHARVHLQKNPVRQLGFVCRQHIDLLATVHHMPQVKPRAKLEVALFKHALEQQDGPAPTQGSYPLCLLEVEQGKAIGPAQTVKNPLDAVSVGIGLDHRPDSGIWRSGAQACHIGAQCIGVNGGSNGAGHRTRGAGLTAYFGTASP